MIENVEATLVFSGAVQGVGFRRTIVKRALKFHLRGTVKNLSEGSVVALVQGEKKNIEAFYLSLQQDAENATIQKSTCEFSPVTTDFSDFKILY